MSRIAHCEFTGSDCNDPSCKAGFCIREKDRVVRQASLGDPSLIKEIDWMIELMHHGRPKPSAQTVRRLRSNPKMAALARKRLSEG
jgi:hypothetical protein